MKDIDADIDINSTHYSLFNEITKLRNAIRQHRDAQKHERCWLNDQQLYKLLPESKEADFELPPQEEFLKNCYAYWQGCMLKENIEKFEKVDIKNILSKLLAGQTLDSISKEMDIDTEQLKNMFQEIIN